MLPFTMIQLLCLSSVLCTVSTAWWYSRSQRGCLLAAAGHGLSDVLAPARLTVGMRGKVIALFLGFANQSDASVT